MNDLLRELLTMGPGIGQMLSGNGPEAQSFMDGYLRTQQMLQAQKRQKDQDALAAEDRLRMIERQNSADQRAQSDQQWQDNSRRVAMAGELSQAGERAETLPGAESAIDALYQVLSPEMQGTMAPARDQAMRGAVQTITGRQKKQVEAYVEQAVKTSFVADNPDADPELVNLPEHIVKIVGKPAAKLSELQQFAALPIGKPAGKTRIPAAAGSFEEYSDPATTPERKAQIEKDRKLYMQADDRAPRVTVNTGDGIDRGAALKFQDDYARDSKPYLTMREAYQRVKSAKPDAAGDLSLIFAYMKILDPNSVVREQEFANAQNAAGVPDRVRNTYNRVMKGERLNPEQRRQFAAQADALFEGAKTNQRGVRKTYSDRATKWKIPADMVLDEEDEFLKAAPVDPNAPAPRPAAPAGPRKNPFRP